MASSLAQPTEFAEVEDDECDGDDPACECFRCEAQADDRRSLDRYFNSFSR